MTEEDARTRWCPFVRVGATAPGGSVVTVNRHGPTQFPPELCCIAGDCAMWESAGLVALDGRTQGDCGLKRPGSSWSNGRVM